MAAIYMWPVDEQTLLTTTLYPVEAVDSIQIAGTITFGSMQPIPGDVAETHSEDLLANAYYTQVRWFYEDGPYDVDVAETYNEDLISGFYTQVRWFYEDGPYIDTAETSDDLLNGYYTLKGVLADAPTEELQLSGTIVSGAMELI